MGDKKPQIDRYIDENDLENLKQDPEFTKILEETDIEDDIEEEDEDIEVGVEDEEVFKVPKTDGSEVLDPPDFTDFFEEASNTPPKPKSRIRRRPITEEHIEQKLFEEKDDGLEREADTKDNSFSKDNTSINNKSIGGIPPNQEFIQEEQLPPQVDSFKQKQSIFQTQEDHNNQEEFYEDDLDDSDSEDEEEYEEAGFQMSSNLEEVLFAPPVIKPGVGSVRKGGSVEVAGDSKMESFTSGLKNKRKDFWDDLKNNSESEILDAEPEETKMQSQLEFKKNINDQIHEDKADFLSFKKTCENKTSSDNIHFSLALLFDKLNLLGFKKEEATLLLDSFETSTINKLTAILSVVELTSFHLKIIKEMGRFIDDVQGGNGSINIILSEFLRNNKAMIHTVKFTRPDSKIKIGQTNYGLLPSRFMNKINVSSLDQHIKTTRRQYMFAGILRSGVKIEGLVIPIDKIPKGTSNVVNLFARFGYTVHDGDLVFMFLGKDGLNNKSIYLIK